jgi:hypothetical protein
VDQCVTNVREQPTGILPQESCLVCFEARRSATQWLVAGSLFLSGAPDSSQNHVKRERGLDEVNLRHRAYENLQNYSVPELNKQAFVCATN